MKHILPEGKLCSATCGSCYYYYEKNVDISYCTFYDYTTSPGNASCSHYK